MSLKVTTEPKENCQLVMTIEVDEDRVNQELRKAARRVAQRIRIPGFRAGRAPYNVVVRHVGVGALFEEFVDDLGQEVYKQAIEQEEIQPYAMASLDNIELDPLRYQLTIPVDPEVTLGDYRSLRVEEPEAEIDEEEVQERIDELLDRQAGYEESEGPSEYGDLITVDARAVVLDEEGNETDTVVLDEEDWDVTPDQENPMEPAGFDEELVGMAPGDEKTFDIAWPEESPSMYAGKNVRFRVTVHQIQRYQRPALTDEVAQSIGPEYEGADDLVQSIRESMEEEQAEENERAYLDEVLGKLVEMSELEYPPAAVELQIDQILRNTDNQLRQMGLQGLDQYLQMVGQTAEAYREDQREQAESFLQRNLVIAEIGTAEQIEVSEAEFDERLAEMLGEEAEDATDEQKEARQSVMEMMRQPGNRDAIEDQIVSEKTLDRILAIARGEEVPEPGEEATVEAEITDTEDGDDADEDGGEATEMASAAESSDTEEIDEGQAAEPSAPVEQVEDEEKKLTED